MFRDGARRAAPDRTSGGSRDIKARGEEKGRNIGRKKGGMCRGGVMPLVILSFHFSSEAKALFDLAISLCSLPLGPEMSSRWAKWWPLIQISPLRHFLLLSPRLPPGLLSSSLGVLRVRAVDQILLTGNEILRDSVHSTMLSVTFALSLNGYIPHRIHTQVVEHTPTHTHTHLILHSLFKLEKE